MNLSELKHYLTELSKQEPGETAEEYAQRTWNNLPRIPYKELPASLQKAVRESYTAEQIQAALIISYITEKLNQSSPWKHGYSEAMKDIPQSDHERIMIATRNNAVYTIEGKVNDENNIDLEPILYANYLYESFEQTIKEYKGRQTRIEDKDGKKRTIFTRTSLQKAGEANIIPTPNHQRIPSSKDYQYALTGKVNQHAFIAYLGDDFFEKLKIKRDENFIYDETMEKRITQYRNSFRKQKKSYPITEIDFPLLVQHFTNAFETKTAYDTNTVTVYTPQFFRRMGIDPTLAMQEIFKFRDLWGILPKKQKILSVFTLIAIDHNNNTMTFACPYFMELFGIIPENNHIERKTRAGELIEYDKPTWNELCHTNIVSEKNKPAVELVYLVTNSLLTRGTIVDSNTYRSKGREYKDNTTITYSISFSSLINDTVILKDRLKNAKNQTATIQRAFKGFYKLLHEKTDVYEYFCNFKVSEVIPGKATLNEKLIVTFTGINGHYVKTN